jgi:hypothetical protein
MAPERPPYPLGELVRSAWLALWGVFWNAVKRYTRGRHPPR